MGLVCSYFRALSPPVVPRPPAVLPSSTAPPSAAALPSSAALSSSAAPSAPEYYSPRIAEMIEKLKSNPEMDKVDSEVEASKVAWSEVTPSVVMGDELAADNLRVFRSLQAQWPRGLFKGWTEKQWELGEKIAEGGQAELFEVWRIDPEGRRVEEVPWVIKMFKEGLRLEDLQRLLPRGMLANENTVWRGNFDVGSRCNAIQGAMLFKRRFAIMMERKWGDLRKLIDARMIHNNMHGPPFTSNRTQMVMFSISYGMELLHIMDITHGDLKAANVLVRSFNDTLCTQSAFDPIHGGFTCAVADYECSVGVVGTGFWRAPEILLAVKNKHVTPEVFSKASDVYSYGMTCYEIITGHIPFEVEGFKANDYDRVIDGCRPSLPSETPHWIKELLSRCWHKDPLKRPTFKDIGNIVSQHLITE